MKLNWIIDVDIIGEEHINVPNQLRSFGYKVTTLSATKDFPKIISEMDTIYPFHGSFQELSKIKKSIIPATYGINQNILRSHYTSYIPNDWFLNKNSMMTTWGNLYKSTNFWFEYFGNELFIRPDSGNKTFTGQVITRKNFDEQKSILEQFSNIKPETIIWISNAKRIENEYRFWISNKKIATCCEYSWEKEKQLGIVPMIAMTFANKIANYEWQVDSIYVVDISIIDNYPSIIEFNSFSCSGLYTCDSKELFKIVSEDIITEWNQQF